MEYSLFSRNLRYYRKYNGLTQNQLGLLSRLGQVSIANYEAGRRFPNEKNLSVLAKVLNIEVSTFFTDRNIDIQQNNLSAFSIDGFIKVLIHETIDSCFEYIVSWKESLKYSLQKTYNNILISTLREVGNRWEKNELLIAEEHIISEKIRSLIILLSNKERSLKLTPVRKDLVWLGFAAPGEQHYLVLLMFAEIARNNGWEVFFVGKDIPVHDLIKALMVYKPKVVFVSIQMEELQEKLTNYLNEIDFKLKNKPLIYVGGRGCHTEYAKTVNCVDGFIKTFNQGCKILINVEEKL
ncbi:MAG: helix-turn-helix domain-containing protein [Spirochaetales bacterium]|nr:helix-turn-helix domain-containing protein [Spirochaetales bacterium]